MSVIRKDGFDFGFDPGACKNCSSRCCRGKSGRIWLNHREIFQICGFLEMNAVDFIGKYLHREGSRLSIRERFSGHDFECVFLKGPQHTCSIYEVRPMQCRQFPFWDYFRKNGDEAFKECPGVRESSVEDPKEVITGKKPL